MVSVIVPVYNVEDYLPICLNSILSQTYKELEIILVDDGSTDRSGKICEDYARRDNRIRVIHQKNEGLPCARNIGLKEVRGDYVILPDGDDAMHPQMLDILLRNIISSPYDFAMCYGMKVYDVALISSLTAETISHPNEIELDRDLCLTSLFSFDINYHVVWNKLYSSSIINSLLFADTPSEDIEFNNRVYLQMNKAILLPIPLYYYVQRSSSILGQGVNLRWANTVFSWKLCLDAIPQECGMYRALCLRHLYKMITYKRYYSRRTPYYQAAIDNAKLLRKATIKEYFNNSHIAKYEKLVYIAFSYIPFLYSLFVCLTDFLARLKKN